MDARALLTHDAFFHINIFASTVTARSPLEKTRYETSLGLLTKKFVSLFHSSSSGTVDLNKVKYIALLLPNEKA